MIDQVLLWIEQLMSSAWVYPAMLGMSLLDSLIPLFPSEAPLILGGVYAASTGTPNLFGIMAAAAFGAWCGDHLTYLIGRRFAGSVDRWPPRSRRGRAVAAARTLLRKRGGMALVVARFIPWGRIATTLVMGATRYPLRSFSAYDALGTVVWAAHGGLLGYLGGAAFRDEPVKGLVLGLALAVVVSALMELARWWWQRRRSTPAAVASGPQEDRTAQRSEEDSSSDGTTSSTWSVRGP